MQLVHEGSVTWSGDFRHGTACGNFIRVGGFIDERKDVLRNLNTFITPNPFAALHQMARKGDRKFFLSQSLHPRLTSHIDLLSYLFKILSLEPRKMFHFVFHNPEPRK